MNFYIILGFIIGFIFFLLIDTGEKNKTKIFNITFSPIIINFLNNSYHIHHWIIFLALFLILLPIIGLYGYCNIFSIFLGICLGSILQGLTYNDAFEIKIK